MKEQLTFAKGLKKMAGKPAFATIVILIAMIVIVASLQSNFFEYSTIVSNINSFTPLILLGMGQAIVLLSGSLDLSAGNAMAAILCIITQIMKADQPETGFIAIAVAIAVAVGIGLVNGLGVGYLRLPPIIATFASSYIWLGVALLVTPTAGGEIVPWFKGFYDISAIQGATEGMKAFGKAIPSALLLIAAGCVIWYVISRTKTGRYIYATGSNNENAFSSGINTARIQTIAFIINAFFIMLCAFFFAGQNGAANPRIGETMTLTVIASAVVGGVSTLGGKGSVYGAIGGALIMGLVSKIIYFAKVPNAYQTLISGIIIIIAVASSSIYAIMNQKAVLKGEGE